MPISTFQVDGVDPDGQPQEAMSGCHQPAEKFSGNVLPFAWFARGLRLLDISDPFRPREVGCYEPDPPAGCERASSNDVTTDDRGLLYLLDRQRGLDIIESSVYGPDHDLSATSLWQQESQPAVPSGGAGGRLRSCRARWPRTRTASCWKAPSNS